MTLFLLCSYFRAHPTTLLLKILGGTDAWAVPTSNLGGAVPPVAPRSPPLHIDLEFWMQLIANGDHTEKIGHFGHSSRK